jgi:uncharacterized SAM-binding protein YcdF (DUF218 family)
MKSKIYSSGILLIIVVLNVGSCRKAGVWLVKRDEPVNADAMVILMGSIADRILHAVDLFQNRVADKVIIVEGGMGAFRELIERGADIISGTEQIRNAIVDLGITTESIIILPGNAQSTQDEALIIREYLSDKPGIDTLLLVSSKHHTRRAYMIFKDTFRNSQKHIYIFCSPSPYTDFNPNEWWKSKDGIETVLLEYLKLINFVLFERSELK